MDGGTQHLLVRRRVQRLLIVSILGLVIAAAAFSVGALHGREPHTGARGTVKNNPHVQSQVAGPRSNPFVKNPSANSPAKKMLGPNDIPPHLVRQLPGGCVATWDNLPPQPTDGAQLHAPIATRQPSKSSDVASDDTMHRDPAWNHPGLSQAYAQWRSGAAGLTTRVAAARAERGESDSPRLDLETESRRFPPAVNAEMDPLAGHDLLDMDDLLEDTIDPLMQSPPAASSSESVQRPSGVRLPIPDDDGALLNNDDLMTDQQSRGADDLLGDVLLSDDDLLGDDNDLLGSDDDLLGGDDDLLGGTGLGDDDDDPLSGMGAKKPIKQLDSNEEEEEEKQDKDPHADLFTQNLYPSASTCKKCHPAQYEQWRASAHAYSTVSPMFQLFDEAMQKYTRGTVGYFCVRCHSPVAVQLEQPRFTSVLDAPEVTREGVTCIACHRVREAYGRSNGDRRIEPGDIYQPVYGSKGGQGVADAVANAKKYKLRLDPSDEKPGQPIHREGRCFEQLSKSDFCASCHQVAVHPGIWLEVVHAQYRSGPAAAKGITCQDCHMGRVPGKAEGYATGYSAYLNDKPYGQPGKRSNHSFWGPGYSLAHPGVFPFNDDAKRWTTRQWMAFDYRSGWGTKAYEDLEEGTQRPKDETFPKPWDNSDERRDARKIIDTNLKRLQVKRSASIATMEAGSRIDGPFVRGAGYRVGDAPVVARGAELHFHYNVHNISDGHNMPSGSLGAQPQLWLNVSLINPQGVRIWESGDLDQHGDLRDLHSTQVNNGILPRDSQLFNLQTKFLITNVKGTDREAALPLNFSLDQLVFLRPGAVPVSVLNHPPLIRMEAHSIPPLDHRSAKYRVPGGLLNTQGVYRLSVRMRSRPEPIYFMRQIDATPQMIRRINEQILDLHPQTFSFVVQ